MSWGDWAGFTGYTAGLLHHPPVFLVTVAAVGATATEIVLAVLLVTGWQRRWVGKATAGLFFVYLVALAAGPDPAEVIGYAMPVLIGGALLLSATPARRREARSAAESAPGTGRGDEAPEGAY